jgi:hypothetical protein
MRNFFHFLIFLVLLLIVGSCKKAGNTDKCFPGVATVRQITDKPAVIKVTATVNGVYIVEQSSIDTKLIPCNLAKEFVQNDLQVIISGDVKETPQGSGPCCTENFVITKITR